MFEKHHIREAAKPTTEKNVPNYCKVLCLIDIKLHNYVVLAINKLYICHNKTLHYPW